MPHEPDRAAAHAQRRRRAFLRLGTRTLAGAGLALGAHPLLSSAQAASAGASARTGGYRALVCVFLQGGCDGFSLFVPTDGAGHREYERTRARLALGRAQLLELTGTTGDLPSIGLHAAAAPLRASFDEGRLAAIANVGNLIEPTTRADYESGAAAVPAQLFSHADQEVQWQQLQGRHKARDGWGALAAGELATGGPRDHLGSISLAGSNHWQAGARQRPFSMLASGIVKYPGLDPTSGWTRPRRDAFERVVAIERDHLLAREYAALQRRAMDDTAELGAILASRFPTGTPEPVAHAPGDKSLAAKLNMVAKLIAVQSEVGLPRQIFYVRVKGYDVHSDQNTRMPALFAELSQALHGFQGALDELGMAERVTTFTASDFGRSLSGNGDGTDHGWGNHLFALGGAVRGGRLYGTLPRLDADGPDSVQNGRVLPTLAATQYAATLLRWLGLDDAGLARVLPTLGNFETTDLGFLA